ncbi:MAG: hypothetical protein CSA62_00645 [Planctomycetota bacterium]|nr:MAG: hypothetical protein CSA62_00645 [Planctomycetota bacterium]
MSLVCVSRPRPVFYLYIAIEVFSRKIVAAELHERECSTLTAQMIEKACLTEELDYGQLVPPSDNGKLMKDATLQDTAKAFGISVSFSRPSDPMTTRSKGPIFARRITDPMIRSDPSRRSMPRSPGSNASLTGTGTNPCTATSATSCRHKLMLERVFPA